MLDAIIRLALGNRVAVLFGALLIGALGLWRAANTQIDVLPDLDRPVVTVMTEAHGMVPVDVERLVTWPLEQVLNGATGVHRVRSKSGAGLSTVIVEFDWGTDLYRDRQVVSEKLQLARGALPDGVQPVMTPVSSIMGQILLVGFRSETGATDALTLRRIVDRDVRPRLLSLGGVAQVVAQGGQPTEVLVSVDADAMRALGVTLEDVAGAVERANLAATGGRIDSGPRGASVSVDGLIEDAAQLGQALVRDDEVRPVVLADVAEVSLGASPIPVGSAGIDGREGVVVVVTKQPGVDTVALTRAIEAELEDVAAQLPDDVAVSTELFQQAAFIERAIDNVLEAVRDGSILVVLVLLAFLVNLRTTLITLTAIPMSIAIAALVFGALGLTINTMTLGGLAVAIGTLVDDAIVDVENVHRRLHENARRADPESILRVVFRASSEIRRPVLYGTLLVTVVYLPLFFLSGIEGRLFAPIGLAFLLSVFASLLVALTLTPVLCSYLLASSGTERREYGSRLVGALRDAAGRAARWSIEHTAGALAVGVAGVVACLVLLSASGTTFLPAFNEGSAQVNLVLPPDASFAVSDAYGAGIEALLGEVEGVGSVARRTGRAAGDEHAMPIHVSETILTFDPDSPRPREEILEDIRARVTESFPGVASSTEQPLAHLLSHLLSGVNAQVAIKIFGPDLGVLRGVAAEVEGALRGVQGVRDLYVEPQVLIDQIEVVPRRAQLARLGADVDEVAHTVELATGGEPVASLLAGRVRYPIRVLLEARDREDLGSVGELTLHGRGDELVRVRDVADVRYAKTPTEIGRENGQRRIVVQHNVGGRSLGEVVADVERALRPIRAELEGMPGYDLRVGGLFEAQAAASRRIAVLSALSVALMGFLLIQHFRSPRIAALVLGTRPLALIGGAVWVLATGQVLSVATLVGFVALLGMATRNGILLVDHTVQLVRDEGAPWSDETVVRAARERIVPVLMTALTSGIGLLPLALSPDQPGRELLHPVASVVAGGLVTSTLLDFLLLPGLVRRVLSDPRGS